MARKFDMQEAQKIIQEGQKIEEFLSDPSVKSMINRAIASYHSQWENSEPKDSATRESLYLKIRALKDLLREFSAIIDEAKAAQVVARSVKLKGGMENA